MLQFLLTSGILLSNSITKINDKLTLSQYGNIEGTVVNGDGFSIANVLVGIDGITQTTTSSTGYYILENIPVGQNIVVCLKEGYNTAVDSIIVIQDDTLNLDFSLTQPNITVAPTLFSVTLNPNEYLTQYMSLLNTGDGEGEWAAVINYLSKTPSYKVQKLESSKTRDFSIIETNPKNVVTIPQGNGQPLSARSGFNCPVGSVFSYPPLASDNAYSCEENAGTMCYQSFSGVSGGFSTITIYALHTTLPSGPRELLVEVYESGSTPGALESSSIVMADPIGTGIPVLGYQTFSYTFDVPVSSLSSGWIGIQATSGGSPTFYWLNTHYTPAYTAMQNNTVLYDGLAMCLASNEENWLTLEEYEGVVLPYGGIQNIGVNFDASGMEDGDVHTAEIIITTDPNVGTFTIPVNMLVAGDPLCPVYDLGVELVNMVTSQVGIYWMFDFASCSSNFQYFIVKRDGVTIGTTTDIYYDDMLPNYGTYCYTVIPVFDIGQGIGATTCVEWEIPAYCWSPNTVYNEQWVNSQEQVDITIENCGLGVLDFIFPDHLSGSRFACDMEVALYDTYGDGWNGGSLDVFVNGNLILDDLTIVNGGGPEYHSFPVEGGDDISTIYTAGSWSYENYYEFYDGDGILIYTAADESIPVGVVFGTCPQPGFILDVEPPMGQIQGGQSMNISVTYDATGFPNGLFNEWLLIETNDPQHQEDSILNQMLVYDPGLFYGYVNNCSTGLPIPGVTVIAGDNSATTNGMGYYEMYVDADTYDIEFSFLGFESQVFVGGTVSAGGMTEISICLNETPYPVSWVFAEPDEVAGTCLVTWSLPMGPYEIIYDDGYSNEFVIWTTPGNAIAVNFTPAGYPATIIGGRFFVGDGTFPSGSTFLGTSMGVGVMDDDGVNGMPGTILDSTVITINNLEWVDFYGLFSDTINDGNFYIVLWQLGYSSFSAPIGVDTDAPTVYRSYVKFDNNPWSVSPYQDFMIRAYVDGPNDGVMSSSSGSKASPKLIQLPKVTEGPFIATGLPDGIDGTEKDGEYRSIIESKDTRDLLNYTVAKVTDFDPVLGPQTGILTPIANPTNYPYLDQSWGGLPPGYYAYAVKVVYDANESIWVYSNTVPHLLYNTVTVVVYSCNDSIENSNVYLIGYDYPYEVHQGTTNTNGIVVFDSVIDGYYDMHVEGVGYTLYEYGYNIYSDTTIGVELLQNMYPPTNLEVDPLTSVATWDEPLITELYLEDFEDPTFPPDGWQATAIDVGWFRTEDASSGNWPVPPGDGYYASTNDDVLGTGYGNSTMDYLITPQVDLRESDDFQLYFTQFYDGSYGQSAYVEYSNDQGTTWEVIETMSPQGDWNNKIVDLAPISGPNSVPVMLAFHSDDHNSWASGWAVDNVEIKNGPAPVLAYYVFLDNVFEAQTGWNETTYTFTDLTYGVPYETCVVAVYDCGVSDPVCTTWESIFLLPPLNLTNEYLYNTNEVPLMWNPPEGNTGVPDELVSFNIYRDSVVIANVAYGGQGIGEWITFIDNELDPNTYNYWVSAVYDLADFGYPGETAESVWEGPDEVSVVWGFTIPFFEDWGVGTFAFNNWTFNENSDNWSISSQEGEPAPSAEFTWDPLLENDYSSTLTSYPIIVDYLTEGDLFLDFDIKLIDRNSTGNEKMLVEIYDGTIWHLAAEFANSGKEGFTNNLINITQYAIGNAINIRFNATGQNSFDIISWYIDNVNVYRECVAPTDLTGQYIWISPTEIGAEICWEGYIAPSSSQWFYYDDETIEYVWGSTSDWDVDIAIKIEQDDLINFDGAAITQYRAFVDSRLLGVGTISVKVYQGDNPNPSAPIYEEDVTSQFIAGDDWNDFMFSQAVLIDINQPLWMGMYFTGPDDTYGPGITSQMDSYDPNGDLLWNAGSWDHIQNQGISNRAWLLRGFVTTSYGSTVAIGSTNINPLPVQTGLSTVGTFVSTHASLSTLEVNNTRSEVTFNIYRKGGASDYVLLAIVPSESGTGSYCYYDTDVFYPTEYCYKVTASYESATDYCESAPANAYELPMNDHVCVFNSPINVDNPNEATLINVYPNPATDEVHINSTLPIQNINVVNYFGQSVYTSETSNSSSHKLNTTLYSSGIYLIQIETDMGITTRKVIIKR